MQVQMDNGFAAMKQYIGRQFVTLNDNVRRFGGTIQGGFARQDPTQPANRQAATSAKRKMASAFNEGGIWR